MHLLPEAKFPVEFDGPFISVPDGKSDVFTSDGIEVFESRLEKPPTYALSSVSESYIDVADVTPFVSHIKWCGDRLLADQIARQDATLFCNLYLSRILVN